MKLGDLVFSMIALAVGVALGSAACGGRDAPASGSDVAKEDPVARTDSGLASRERALSARIRELEAMYKAASEPEKPEVEKGERYWRPFVTTNEDGSVTYAVSLLGGGFSFDLKKQMEELREKDPEEFERRANFRKRMGDEIADGYDQRILFFEQVDDSWMGDSDRERYDRFLDTLKTASDVSRRGGRWDLPFEERKQVDAYAFRINPTIPNEYPKIRSMFLNRTTELMGLDGASADDFVSSVNAIERMTSRYAAVSLP